MKTPETSPVVLKSMRIERISIIVQRVYTYICIDFIGEANNEYAYRAFQFSAKVKARKELLKRSLAMMQNDLLSKTKGTLYVYGDNSIQWETKTTSVGLSAEEGQPYTGLV